MVFRKMVFAADLRATHYATMAAFAGQSLKLDGDDDNLLEADEGWNVQVW